MDDFINSGVLPLSLFALIVVTIIWQVGASWRARALLRHENDYRALTERTLQMHDETARRLGDMATTLGDLKQKVASVEHILKDAE